MAALIINSLLALDHSYLIADSPYSPLLLFQCKRIQQQTSSVIIVSWYNHELNGFTMGRDYVIAVSPVLFFQQSALEDDDKTSM